MICSNQIDESYGHYYSIRLFLGPLNVKLQFIIPSMFSLCTCQFDTYIYFKAILLKSP